MPAAENTAPSDIATLYNDHHGWLQGWLRLKLGDAFDAADLAHDAFVRLLTKPRSFDSFDGARAYLSTMGRGLCADLWRRRTVERAWLQALAAQPQAVHPSPEHRAIVIETLCEIGAMLARLPRKAASAFVMAQVHGMTYREIAVELDVSERMVKKYMAQAMLHCALVQAGFEPGCTGAR